MGLFISFTTILVTVVIHYEGLRLLSKWFRDMKSHRVHSILLMCGLTILHVIEITIFACVYWGLHYWTAMGDMNAKNPLTFLDHFNFSLTNYTTLAVGKICLDSTIKLVSGMEGLNGFMLLTWSASFLYRGAGKFWERKEEHE